MKILYIAAIASRTFREKHGDLQASGLGGERKVRLMVEALLRGGHEVTLLSSVMLANSAWRFRPAETETLPVAGRAVSVHYPAAVMVRPLGGILSVLRAPSLLRRMIASLKPDAVIAYNAYMFESRALHALAHEHHIPAVLQVDDLPLARHREFLNAKPRLDHAFWRRSLRDASAFLAVNRTVFDLLPTDRPKYLMPGAVADELIQIAQNRQPCFAMNRLRVGYFGGLKLEKGLGMMLDLVPRLPDGFHLVIGGAGPLANEVRKLALAFPGKLTFSGLLDGAELFEALCSCDVTLIPPERIEEQGEGVFPFKTFEYLVADTHVIADRIPALGDGLDLQFVNRGVSDADSLLKALLSAKDDYAAETSRRTRARAAILEQFSIGGVARTLSTALNGALASRRLGL